MFCIIGVVSNFLSNLTGTVTPVRHTRLHGAHIAMTAMCVCCGETTTVSSLDSVWVFVITVIS